MLSWIPFIGPVIQGFVSIFSKVEDTALGKYKVDGSVDVEGMKASAQIIQDTHQDISIRILTDGICLFPVIWTMIIGWDTIMIRHYPEWCWIVEKYPPSVEYLPYAVMVFLIGNIGVNAWKRK